MRATSVAKLCVGRAGRLMLHLCLRTLLLLWSLLLQAHLLQLPLAHQLSIILLVVGCSASGIHVGILLHWSLLLLLLLLRDVWLLLLRLMCLILSALLGAASIAVSAVRDSSVGLVRGLIVIVCRRVIVCGLLLLLLRVADPSSGIHCILTHLTRRLRLVLQLFSGEVGKLDLGHLRIACPQLILDLYNRRNVTRR
jgi:uncharacterized protein (TIGR03382 family)